jgi:replicative superfamily II helicase
VGRKCSTHGSDTNVYKVLVGTPERERLLVRRRHSWKNNIKTDDVGRIYMVADRKQSRALSYIVMHLRAALRVGNLLPYCS